MNRKERYTYILDYFRARHEHVTTELDFGSAFQLLCATLLSAQCTDKRINAVTPALFAKYPTAQEMAKAEPEDVFLYVHSVSYPNAKSRHLVEMARMIVSDFGGEVPDDPKLLVKLPGVGRKTANIVLNVGFGIVEGIAVDTHVNRIAHRLMLSPKTHAKEPLKTEQDLLKILPHEYWESVNHQWITFGREICDARKPKCDECPLADLCPSVRVAG